MSEAPRGYEPLPCYPAVGEAVVRGWDAAVRSLPTGPTVLAVDGPHVLNWAALVAGLSLAVTEVLGTAFETRDVRDDFAPWSDILARTSSPVLRDDPDFETIPDWRGGLYAMLGSLPTPVELQLCQEQPPADL